MISDKHGQTVISLSSQLTTAQGFEYVFRAIHEFSVEYDGVSDKHVSLWDTRNTL